MGFPLLQTYIKRYIKATDMIVLKKATIKGIKRSSFKSYNAFSEVLIISTARFILLKYIIFVNNNDPDIAIKPIYIY